MAHFEPDPFLDCQISASLENNIFGPKEELKLNYSYGMSTFDGSVRFCTFVVITVLHKDSMFVPRKGLRGVGHWQDTASAHSC
jgi:hypothetical protein